MKKVNHDQAVKDFENWLEFRRVNERKRESNVDSEIVLVEAIEDGRLIVNDDFTLTLNLVWPTGEDERGVSQLIFKPRLTAGQRQDATKGVSPKDSEGRLIGYISALTDQPMGVIKKLESGDDYDTASSIAVYFL